MPRLGGRFATAERVGARAGPAIRGLKGDIGLGGGGRARGETAGSGGRTIATERRDDADEGTAARAAGTRSGVEPHDCGPTEERSGRDRDGGALDERGREAQSTATGPQLAQSLGRRARTARAAGGPTEERLRGDSGGAAQRRARAIQKTTHRVLINPQRTRR